MPNTERSRLESAREAFTHRLYKQESHYNEFEYSDYEERWILRDLIDSLDRVLDYLTELEAYDVRVGSCTGT